ncbi:MAG: MFS transporter [Alphaproteobacteria bacterium]|nr:MFS transporter [Alphaproteobacteria bacterium]
MTPAQVARIFLAFAFAYFLSTLVRAITATLSPTLIDEFNLQARDLGLLAGGYFLGFAATQLPMGRWLDSHGPRKVVCALLLFAVLGSVTFSVATEFNHLFIARLLTGIGVSACLMAPLTGFRRWLPATSQVRANAWMLMTGSLGSLASTLPVQWLLPSIGWRPIFLTVAVLTVLAIAWLWWQIPSWPSVQSPSEPAAPALAEPAQGLWQAYAPVWRNRYFQRMAPLAFFVYGGMIAMQTLWAGPWMVKVSGYSPLESATGLFWINVVMLCTFTGWGLVTPALARHGWGPDRLIAIGLPLNILSIGYLVWQGAGTGAAAWSVFFFTCSFVSLAQPAIGLAFPSHLAGRALSAYNLLIFSGVFLMQWGFGWVVDLAAVFDLSVPARFQLAMAVLGLTTVASNLWFVWRRVDNEG